MQLVGRAGWLAFALVTQLAAGCGDPFPERSSAPAASGTTGAARVPPCADGAGRCQDATPLLCHAGQWIAQPACAPVQVCFAGRCAPPSCAKRTPGADFSCGVDADDCCASPLVPGGTYFRGYDGIDFVEKTHPATVTDFRLDRYAVTVGRFRAFVESGGGVRASIPAEGDGAKRGVYDSGWHSHWNGAVPPTTAALVTPLQCHAESTWTDAPGTNEHLPMVCVDWFDAMLFCIWDGGRLPTETEYAYAQSGGDEQRYYPWSKEPVLHPTLAVYPDSPIVAVGMRSGGAGRWGQLDLSGNAWTWVYDLVVDGWTPSCNDCFSIGGRGDRRIRGGSWVDPPERLRSADRHPGVRDANRYRDVGIRCARDP